MGRSIHAGLEPYRKDPAAVVQVMPGRRVVTLGWVFRQLLSLFAVFSFLGFVLTLAVGLR